jgi:hypothetical protein
VSGFNGLPTLPARKPILGHQELAILAGNEIQTSGGRSRLRASTFANLESDSGNRALHVDSPALPMTQPLHRDTWHIEKTATESPTWASSRPFSS